MTTVESYRGCLEKLDAYFRLALPVVGETTGFFCLLFFYLVGAVDETGRSSSCLVARLAKS